ncbi:MAG: acyl-CoA thioesterase [Saprospiraceae bacterium]|jgi:acyl-CoA thioester hydrolase
MYSFETHVRVRYAETDQMKYLYYGNYAQYFEVGRVELMRSLGLSYRELEEKYMVMMPVVYMQQRFIRPALYDDNLRVVTAVRELESSSITFYSDIYNEEDKLLNSGYVRLCFIDIESNQRIQMPIFLYEKLVPFFK